jgi:limonene-1,2-epoxide hydrolase
MPYPKDHIHSLLINNKMERKRVHELAIVALVGLAAGYFIARTDNNTSSTSSNHGNGKTTGVVGTVTEFLDAQSQRNLEKMCALVDDDIVYINEPHPPERAIRGKKMFRDAFAASPCIWCEKANLQVLQMSHQEGSDTVFVERHDQFFIDGHWLAIPICGYLKVKNGKVVLWKDYWDYAKYKEFVTRTYGPDFRLFRTTVKGSS